jgi:hypothetical protein
MSVCARCNIPETMLIIATKFGLEHWVVRNAVASEGS